MGLPPDADAAIVLTTATQPDVAVLDNTMPERSGIDAAPDLIAAGAHRVILHTAHASNADREIAHRLGIAIIAKMEFDRLLTVIRANL